MFRFIRVCFSGMIAGFIGMFVGLVGEIYVYEFSDRSDALLQAAVAFSELDNLSFLVCYFFVLLFLLLCLAVEVHRFIRRYRSRKTLDKTV